MNIYSTLTEHEQEILYFVQGMTEYHKEHPDEELISMQELIDTSFSEPEGSIKSNEEVRESLMKRGYLNKKCKLTIKGKRFLNNNPKTEHKSNRNITLSIFNVDGELNVKSIVIYSIAIVIIAISLLVLKMNNVSAIPSVNITVDIPE